MKRLPIGPVGQISLALALMACVLVFVGLAGLRVLGDGEDEVERGRRLVAESLALQGAGLMSRGDIDGLRRLMKAIADRDPRIGSIAVRRANGQQVALVGDPTRVVPPSAGGETVSSRDHVRVPLFAGSEHWGDVEIAYGTSGSGMLARGLEDPLVPMLGFVFVAGSIGFGLFMRRVLQHLDPSSAIPERVRNAFDTLIEGIVIVDGAGRIVLANQAFQALRGDAEVRDGVLLTSLGWRRTDVAPDDAIAPWARAMNEGLRIGGVSMRIGDGDSARDVVVSCSPIRDGRDAVRGCLVSFADVTAVERANTRLRSALAELERSRREVEESNRALQRAATRDPLTDCLNRRAFAAVAVPTLQRARRPGGSPLSALLLDIDHFKSVNDRFGHAVGDRVIRAVAEALGAGVRPMDVVARHGGEEFAVMMPGCDAETAARVADRLRTEIAARCAREFGGEFPELVVTVSIGVSDTVIGGATLDALLDEADSALYEAKRGGRNRVVVHEPAVLAPSPAVA
jgi:diguanylate cyclase (GGDEF)-like protein